MHACLCAQLYGVTTYQLARPALLGGDLLQLQADLLADHLASREDGDVLQRRLAVVSEPGSLNRAHLLTTTKADRARQEEWHQSDRGGTAQRQRGDSRVTERDSRETAKRQQRDSNATAE